MPIKSRSKTNKVYKFVHRKDEYLRTTIKGIEYQHPDGWIEIKKDGLILINASCFNGYAWDGCTPKKEILDFIIGTPDGKLDYLTEKPITYYASFVHDIFYQFKSEVPLSRKTVDQLFLLILKDAGFIWWRVYYFFVRIGGGIFGQWRTKEKINDVEITACSWIEDECKRIEASNIEALKSHPFMKANQKYKSK